MKSKPLYWTILLTATASIFLLGCSKPEDEFVDENTSPPKLEFKGTIDPKVVGKWDTADKSQHLTISADGKARMQSTVNTPGGKKDLDVTMDWKVDQTKLYFQTDAGAVQGYEFTLKGNELTLKTSKSTTVYIKAK